MLSKKKVLNWIILLKEIGFVAMRGLRHFKKLGADTRNYAKSAWLTISIVRMEAAAVKNKVVKLADSDGGHKRRLYNLDQKISYVLRLLKSKPILFGELTDDQLKSLINDYMQGAR